MPSATSSNSVLSAVLRLASIVIALHVGGATAGTPAQAARSVADYHHATWTAKDGAPRDTWAIAQTNDGWLWFAGPTGLFRFDGISFERRAFDADDQERPRGVSALLALSEGGLIVGFQNGGIGVLRDGRFTSFDNEHTRMAGLVFGFAQDDRGALWAATRGGLLRLDGSSWRPVGPDQVPEGGYTRSILLDDDGTLWIAMPAEVLRLRRGAQRAESVAPVAGTVEFVQAPDGRVWAVTEGGLHQLPGQPPKRTRAPNATSRMSFASLFDAGGWYWNWWLPPQTIAGTVPTVGGVDRIGTVKTVLEDRDGNLWFGDQQAVIHRLTRHSVVRVQGLPELAGAIPPAALAVEDGAVWIALASSPSGLSSHNGVWKHEGSLRQVQPGEVGTITAISSAPDGSVWIGGIGSLRYKLPRTDRFIPAMALPDGAANAAVRGVTSDPVAGLWVTVAGVGLFKYQDGTWQRNGNLQALPKEAPNIQAIDKAGRLWLGYGNGTVARVAGAEVALYNGGDGAVRSTVSAISVGRRVLIGTQHGLFVMREERLVALRPADPRAFDAVSGIAERAGGDVWLNTARGAVLVRGEALDSSATARHEVVPVEIFDEADGFPGPTGSSTTLPRIAQAPDGRLWFAGITGIGVIDPSSTRRKPDAPRAVIVSLAHNDQPIEPQDSLTLPKGTTRLRIAYSALSYTRPERVQFRYRLEGVEAGWVDAGTRRQAAYANLGPGTYRFHVEAHDERMLSNGVANSIAFVIPPTFVQSRLFVALCLGAAMAVLMLLHRLRISVVTARELGRVQVRLRERERVARELHDTLLQAAQGLVLRLSPIARDTSLPGPARGKLDEAIGIAERLITQGRDHIQGLRADALRGSNLEIALAGVGDEAAHDGTVVFRVTAEGAAHALRSEVLEAGYGIAREAILNALRHAQARSIEVKVIYGSADLRVQVCDDGVGLPSDGTPTVAGRHWGLRGMLERAESVGGTFEVWSRPGSGTEARFVLSAERAYVDGRLGWRARMGRMVGRQPAK